MSQASQTASRRTPNPALRAAHDARLFVAPFNRRIGAWRTQLVRLDLFSSRLAGSRLDPDDLGARAAALAEDAERLREAFERRLGQLDAKARANSRIEDTRQALASVGDQARQLVERFTQPPADGGTNAG